MAVNPVSLAESLRPWRDAGLNHLLFPPEDPLLLSVREARARPPQPMPTAPPQGLHAARKPQPAAWPSQEGAALPFQPAGGRTAASAQGSATGAFSGALSGSPAAAHSGSRVSSATVPSTVAGTAPGTAPGTIPGAIPGAASASPPPGQTGARADARADGRADGQTGDPASAPAALRPRRPSAAASPDIVLSWPPRWRELWQRSTAAPLLWTYAELGADLSGSGSAERSSLLRRLMADLAFPKGSSVFWPFQLPDEEQGLFTPQDHPFLQGLGLLSPQVLIFCGSDAVTGSSMALPDLSQPFSQALHSGMLALLLPGLAAMAAEERTYLQTLAFLRGVLSDLAFLRPRKP